tara:strand:- start:399 stop:1181 length:783 start_codon:yes stop_codon:yes gene_type:complete
MNRVLDTKYDKYGDYCAAQSLLEPLEWNFKSHPDFTYMTEHTNKTLGDSYLKQIMSEFSKIFYENRKYLLTCIEENDKYGKTTKYDHNNLITCNSSNIRYIYQSLKICSYIKSLNLNNIDFIEIGGGYGGLCYYLHKISNLFDIKISSYSIFDLEKPGLLLNKYLKTLNIDNVNIYTLDHIDNITLKTDSFLVSTYAFSELVSNIRNEYQKLVIEPYTSHGFIAWNGCEPYNFTKNGNIKVIDNFYTLDLKQKQFPYILF